MEKKQENMLWIPIKTKQLCMNLKIHVAMKYLGAINTTYLVFIKYQQRKRKNTHWPLLTQKGRFLD